MKLTELDPHFIMRCDAPLAFEHTNKIGKAEGMQLMCPACYWSANRRGRDADVHRIILWRPEEPREWDFIGHDYRDLSLMAGRIAVMMTAGCKSRFMVKKGKVDFI